MLEYLWWLKVHYVNVQHEFSSKDLKKFVNCLLLGKRNYFWNGKGWLNETFKETSLKSKHLHFFLQDPSIWNRSDNIG